MTEMVQASQPAGASREWTQGQSDTWWLGVAVAAFAVIAGQAVMVLGGAPTHVPWVNGLTMVFTAALFPTMANGLGRMMRRPHAVLAVAAGAVFLTIAVGPDAEGVRRWLGVSALRVHVASLALPLAISVAARAPGAWTTVGLGLLALGLALQPDAAGAVALAMALLALLALQRGLWTAAAAALSLVAAAWTLFHPDALAPTAWAEGMPFTALEMGPVLGFLVVLGLTLLPAPFVFVAVRGRRRRPLAAAMSIYWIALIVASLVAAFPSPLVGYGAGPILGYVISWALLRQGGLDQPEPGRQR